MTDVLKIGKKALTVSVVFTTILWSIGFAALVAPLVVKADVVLAAGNVIQGTSTKNVFYYAADGKRYTFPTDKVFFSWYKDWTVVKKIPDAQLGGITIGGTIAYKAGTQLVKIQTDPKVYAVEPGGSIRWVETEAIAKSLYGNDWAKKVHDVDPTIFPYVYKVGSSVNSASYPVGALVKVGSDYFYVNAANSKQKVSSDVLAANGFQAKYAVVAANLDGYTAGADMAADAALKTVAGTGAAAASGSAPSASVVGGSVTVALAADTPAATSVIADNTGNQYPQALIPFLKVNFVAGADADAKVTTVKFERIGVAADTDLGNLYLYDGDTKLAEYSSFGSKVVTFSNSAGLFTVSKGATKAVTLKGDLVRASTSISAGKTIGFKLAEAASVVAENGTVGGSFPLSGNLMTTAAVADLGGLYISGYTTYPSTIKADAGNQELWRFSLTSDAQKVQVKYLKLTLVGTIAATEVKNLQLEVGGVKLGSPAALASDKTVVFDLASAPIEITAGQSKVVILRGDMAGGSGRVFKFTIQRQADLVAYDTAYGVYIPIAKDALTTAFGLIEPTTGSGTSVDSGTLTIGLAADSPVGNIADSATSIIFSKLSLYASGEDVKIDNLTASSTCSDGTDILANLKLLLDGSQVGTTDASIACTENSGTNFTFGNTFIVKAGATRYLQIVADTTDSTVAGDATFAMTLKAGTSSNAQGQTTLSGFNTTAQTAATLTIKAGTVVVSLNTSFGNKSSTIPSGTVNAIGVKIGSFIATAGSGEAVDITQIQLSDNATTQVGDNFQNLKLKYGETQVGTTVSSPNTTAGTYTFTPSTAIRVNAGQQAAFDVYADIKSSGSAGDAGGTAFSTARATGVTATGVSTSQSANASSPDIALQSVYIASAGNLTVALDADTSPAQQLVMGDTTDPILAKFKLTADASEDINISEITVSDQVSSAATGTLRNIKLFVDNVQVGQTVSAFSGTDATTTYANAVFSGLSLNIPRNTSKVLVVKSNVTPYDNGATTASTHVLALLVNKGSAVESITAKGVSSGSSITGGSLDYFASGGSSDSDRTASTMTVYATKISVAFAGDTPSGAASTGDDAVVAKFVVTNSANVGGYSATIKYMNFAIAQSGTSKAANTAVELKVYKDSVSTANLVATTSWPAAHNVNIGDTRLSNGTDNSTNFIDAEIAAGTSKTFIVTLDTNNVEISTDTTAETIGVGLASDDIAWRDGVIASDITVVNSLPLPAKSLTYN